MRYTKLVASHPYAIICVIFICSLISFVSIITVGYLPDFSDPQAGFEPRGTVISKRSQAFEQLLEDTMSDKEFELNRRYVEELDRKNETKDEIENVQFDEDYSEDSKNTFNITDPFFCGKPRREYVKLVFKNSKDHNLFNIQSIKKMCKMDKKIRKYIEFENISLRSTHENISCKSWSLGNYIAFFGNKSSCEDITKSDLKHVDDLLRFCANYYHRGLLVSDCTSNKCEDVPAMCAQSNIVYEILHFLSDNKFMLQADHHRPTHIKLSYTMMILPIAKSIATEPLYDRIKQIDPDNNNTELIAMDFGIKDELFNEYLKTDTMWTVFAVVFIFIIVWFYSSSLLISCMNIFIMAQSLIISYFIYIFIFKIEYFPFMNLLTLIILIGLGCDDSFLFIKIWNYHKIDKNSKTLESIVSNTFNQASLSVFVTSLTTASAFYANVISNVTAVKCFAVFAGTVVLIHFLIIIITFPAVLVICEKLRIDCCLCETPSILNEKISTKSYIYLPLMVFRKLPLIITNIIFSALQLMILKLRILWIILFSILSVMGIYVTFFQPGLKLPVSDDFQVFSDNHPFEIYDLQMKNRFWFEKMHKQRNNMMPMFFVWGVKAIDEGDHFNPYRKSMLTYDTDFNIANSSAQKWLLDFCATMRSSKYYKSNYGPQLNNCFIENFKRWMEQSCEDINGKSLAPCCRSSKFPFEESTFLQCIEVYRPSIAKTKDIYFSSMLPGLRYCKSTGRIKALIVELDSNQIFSYNYTNIRDFNNEMENLMTAQMNTAPFEMKSGFFVSYLDFFDLQNTLFLETPIAIGIAIGIATIVAFLTTLNVCIAIQAMISVIGIIFSTISILILIGFKMDVLESISITMAVGLSIDYTFHYGMAYRLSTETNRVNRTISAMTKVTGPISASAFSTLCAGLLMLPSTVLAYHKIGEFLITLSTVSWVYATFYYLSILSTFGPSNSFSQLHLPSLDCCMCNDEDHIDKTQYAYPDLTLNCGQDYMSIKRTSYTSAISDLGYQSISMNSNTMDISNDKPICSNSIVKLLPSKQPTIKIELVDSNENNNNVHL